MGTASKSMSISGGGISIAKSVVRQPDSVTGYGPIAIAAGKNGTLSTRTDNNTGTLTMAGGHGITTGAKIDIYWAGGVQYNVTVGTVSVNSVPFDLGVGDNLPSASTAIIACVRTQVNINLDGDNAALVALLADRSSPSSTAVGHIDFQDAADDVIAAFTLRSNDPHVVDVTGGDTNIYTGDPIVKAFISNGSATETFTFTAIVGQDVTP